MAVDRVNRTVLIVLGLILTAAGVYALLRTTGALFDRDQVVLGPDLRRWAHDDRGWLWLAAGILSGLLALLGLWWLIAQTRRWEQRSVDLTYAGQGPVPWRAVVGSGAIEDAVAADVARDRSVEAANAHVNLDGPDPQVELRVDAHAGTDLPGLTRRIHDDVLERVSQALERPSLTARIRYRLVDPPGRVVR